MRSGKPPRSRQRAAVANAASRLTAPGIRQQNAFSASVEGRDLLSRQADFTWLDGMDLDTILGRNPVDQTGNPFHLYFTNSSLAAPGKSYINPTTDYGSNHGFSKLEEMTTTMDLQSTALPPTPQTVGTRNDAEQSAPYMSPSSSLGLKPPSLDHTLVPLGTPPFEESSLVALDSSHDCINFAIGTLASLYGLSTPHIPSTKMDGTSVHPTIDQVLHINRSAIKSTVVILACSCSKDFCFPILLGIIYSKVLTWYQAIGNISDPSLDMPNGTFISKETVVHRPFAIGAYELDEEVGVVMKHQLILNELREMSKSVKIYVEELCKHRETNDNRDDDDDDDDDDNDGDDDDDHHNRGSLTDGAQLYQTIGKLLQTRLQYTLQELESRLPQ
jgi:Aflatoxin regulatory protein